MSFKCTFHFLIQTVTTMKWMETQQSTSPFVFNLSMYIGFGTMQKNYKFLKCGNSMIQLPYVFCIWDCCRNGNESHGGFWGRILMAPWKRRLNSFHSADYNFKSRTTTLIFHNMYLQSEIKDIAEIICQTCPSYSIFCFELCLIAIPHQWESISLVELMCYLSIF